MSLSSSLFFDKLHSSFLSLFFACGLAMQKTNNEGEDISMSIEFKQLTAALCLSGLIAVPGISIAAGDASDASSLKALKSEVASLKKEMKSLKSKVHSQSATSHHKKSKNHHQVASSDEVSTEGLQTTPHTRFLPFDLDVPGQAFVSTGPYIGVPLQFSGSNLIVTSPSVNNDVQLLNIRKSILKHLSESGNLVQEPTHSHLLLSGIVEGQASYVDMGGRPSKTDFDITNVSMEATFLGPSDWTLGFIELTYDNNPPISNNGQYNSSSNYRVTNSKISVRQAFFTIGNFQKSPFYGTFGQLFVPFGTYSSVMVSDTLPKLLARTKERALVIGYQDQGKNALYGSVYAFGGDSHAASTTRVNNGGVNVGYKFDCDAWVKGNLGAGLIGNIADSAGMQGSVFSSAEQISHRVPAYNLRGVLSLGEHIDLIGEYVSASKRFNLSNLSFNGHGAKPWALDLEASYSFMMLENRPSSIGIGYAHSGQALAVGLPLNRTSVVFNTSVWRNTLQSLEFRRDREYAASNTAGGQGATFTQSGKYDNAVTAQFDYYF
jgi:hypothetical protein